MKVRAFLTHWLSKQEFWLIVLLLLYAIYSIDIIQTSTGVLDPGDAVSHYQISRWSWQYPGQFLNHWGKPFFTLLSSPFAQFGFKGMLVFNLLLALLTAWYVLKLCQKLNIPGGLLAASLCLLSPLYFKVLHSGLTETLCGALFVIGVYHILSTKKWLGTILLSFTPYVRTEAYFLLPFIGLYLIYIKQWKYLLGLGVGSFLYLMIGGFYYGDCLWMLNENPYSSVSDVNYGTGEWSHFYNNRHFIFGEFLSYLLLLGALTLMVRFFLKKRMPHYKTEEEVGMVLLFWVPIITLFAMHSYFWWKGGFASLGLLRVIIPVVPLAAIAGVYTFRLSELIKFKKIYGLIVLIAGGGWMLFDSFMGLESRNDYPILEDKYERIITHAADHYKQNFKDHKAFYFHPMFLFKADLCRFNEEECVKPFNVSLQRLLKSMKQGDLLVWDSQFGVEHSRLRLPELLKCKDLSFRGGFVPKSTIKLYNNENWGIYLFEKSPKTSDHDTIYQASASSLDEFNQLHEEKTYSDLLQYTLENAPVGYTYKVDVSYTIKAEKPLEQEQYFFITAVIQDGETTMYRKQAIPPLMTGEQHSFKESYLLPSSYSKGGNVRTYFENPSNYPGKLKIENLNIRLIGFKDL